MLILKDKSKDLTQPTGYHNAPKHPAIKYDKTGRFWSEIKMLSIRSRS